MDFLVNELSEIPSKIIDFFMYIVDMIFSVVDALKTFYDMLVEFDGRIVQMAESCGTSEFTGMPVVEAIGTFRYLVGDVAFYMIYLTILFGCLLTIYKLVVLLYEAVDGLIMQLTGNNCKALLSSLLNKIFK